jgi:predicted ATP-dependent endonuclease of OLD family
MKLKKVQIFNYRSIKEETIHLTPSCRVLVGINESGKSNILDALSLLSDNVEASPEDEREPLSDETGDYTTPEVRFIFNLNEHQTELFESVSSEIWGSVRSKIASKGSDAITVKNYCKSFREALYCVDIRDSSKYPSLWRRDLNDYILSDGWGKPNSNCPTDYKFIDPEGNEHTLKDFRLIKPTEDLGIPSEYIENAQFSDFHELVKEKVHEIVTDNLPELVYWKYDDSHLLKEKINLEEFIAKPSTHKALRNMFHLAGKTKIKAEINQAKNKSETSLNNLLRRVAEQNTTFFRSVWKEYRDIKFSLSMNGDYIQCSVTEKNDFPFLKRSDGFKRFVAFLLMISTKSHTGRLKGGLLLIDEPESGLHPSGARFLRDELIKISQNNFVVYSTHSIFMIDRHQIDRHILVEKKHEISKVKDATEGNIVNEEVIFNALKFSAFEHIKERNVVFEGWRDKKLLETAIKKPFEKTFFESIGIVHAEGVKSYKWFVPTLELAERKALIISDNDIPAKQAQKEYAKLKYSTQWLRYDEVCDSIDAKTGEDFIDKEYIIAKLKTVTSIYGNQVNINKEDLPENDRLKYIKNKLAEVPYSGEDTTKIIQDLKTKIFETLPRTKIEDRYYEFLGKIKEEVNNRL